MDDCSNKLERAQTLIGGLGGERVRWAETSDGLAKILTNVTGDVLIASGVVSYMGPFTALFREAQLGAINAMCGWYSSFLESEAGTAYAEAIGVDLLPKVAKRWKADADNYAADW